MMNAHEPLMAGTPGGRNAHFAQAKSSLFGEEVQSIGWLQYFFYDEELEILVLEHGLRRTSLMHFISYQLFNEICRFQSSGPSLR